MFKRIPFAGLVLSFALAACATPPQARLLLPYRPAAATNQ